jgi:hypothetical protein
VDGKGPPGLYAATFSADLSGDGRDEFFFGADNRLLAVAAGEDGGKIAWQVELPARLSEPSFADVRTTSISVALASRQWSTPDAGDGTMPSDPTAPKTLADCWSGGG